MSLSVKNVVLVVADAVRYDYAADKLSELGPTYKTIAPSLHTGPSFSSIFSGKHVPAHGVESFKRALPEDVFTMFDIPGLTTAIDDRRSMNDNLGWIMPNEDRRPLKDMEPPFFWAVRTPGGHAPYNEFDTETFEYLDPDADPYFVRHAGDLKRMRRDYEDAISTSMGIFEEIRNTVDEMGELEDTLFIYTSDHGEALGERGYIGHNHLAIPEIVYVPTTLVHTDLEPDTRDELLSSIDLLPTIIDAVDADVDSSACDGYSVFGDFERSQAYNHYITGIYASDILSRLDRTVRSVWDENGGHAFNDTTRRDASILWLGLLTKSPKSSQFWRGRTMFSLLQALQPGHFQYGSPEFDVESAERHIISIDTGGQADQHELTAEQTQQLENLGYL